MAIDTAVIPCGGMGTRLRPITEWIPKELLPVALRPLLFWTLDEAADAGLRRAIVVTNPGKPILEAAARRYGPRLEIACVPQDHPRGLGDALMRARPLLGGDPFVALLPDNLFRGPNATAAVLEVHDRTSLATVLLAEISRADAETKGATGRAVVRRLPDGELRVTSVADKGSGRFDTGGSDVAVTPIGRFAFHGNVFEEFADVARTLAEGAELDDVPVLQRLSSRGELAGVLNPARFYDVGVPEGYHEAVVDFPPQS